MKSRQQRSLVFFSGFFAILVCGVVFLRIVIGPFILASVLAYVFNPSIELLEQRGVKRTVIVSSAIVTIILALVLISWFVFPALLAQLELLLTMLPRVKEYVETHWLPRVQRVIHMFFNPSLRTDASSQLADMFNFSAQSQSDFLLNTLGNSTKFLASWVAACLFAPFFAFFMMRDFRRLMLRALGLVPPDLRGSFLSFVRDVDHTLRSVLRGQILVVTLLSVLYALCFVIVGLPAGLIVGLCTGLARLVPYLDIAVGGTLCFLILVTNSSPPAVVVGVVSCFVLVQLLDALVLTPRIMGQFSGLHPFLIILSVLCFGDWFGFYGVLLAIPLAAVGRVTLLSLLEAYRRSRFFRNSYEN